MNENIEITHLGTATIQVHTKNGLREVTGASILGFWASHKTIDAEGRFTVTHLPTGRNVPYWFASSRQAGAFRDQLAELLEEEGIEVNLVDPLSFLAILAPFKARIVAKVAQNAGLPMTGESNGQG